MSPLPCCRDPTLPAPHSRLSSATHWDGSSWERGLIACTEGLLTLSNGLLAPACPPLVFHSPSKPISPSPNANDIMAFSVLFSGETTGGAIVSGCTPPAPPNLLVSEIIGQCPMGNWQRGDWSSAPGDATDSVNSRRGFAVLMTVSQTYRYRHASPDTDQSNGGFKVVAAYHSDGTLP